MKELFVVYAYTVSMDVDAQNGFTPICPNELPVPNGNRIVEECNKNATKAVYRYMSKDAHPPKSAWAIDKPVLTPIEGLKNVDCVWPTHCVVGTHGFELLDGLPKPCEYNFLVYKGVEQDMHPYSPIYHDLGKKISTGVIEKAKFDEVDTFILGGLALDYCLGEAAFDLKNAGFRVIINLGATKAIGDEKAFVEKAEKAGIEFVNSADEITELPF